MNNIERFKNGDKRLQIVVKGMSDEQKILVQKGFFALGWSWDGGQSESIGHLDKHSYSNCYYKGAHASNGQLVQSNGGNDDDYSETSFTELMILANMESLPEVAQYLDADELKKYNIKQEGNMNTGNEFTKDMLKDGMFVLLRNQENEYSKGYWLVLNDKIVSNTGFVYLKSYNEGLTNEYSDRNHFDIIEVFTSEGLSILSPKYYSEELTSIWKRQSPEEVQRAEKKAELERAILDAEEKIKAAKEALGEL